MRFQGVKSYIHYLAHALNRIVQDILRELKLGSMQEIEEGKDDVELVGPIAKLRYIVV